MKRFALLLSDRARSAYFAETHKIALAEALSVPEIGSCELSTIGPLEFLMVEAPDHRLTDLLRLSVVQGAFRVDDTGFHPLPDLPDFQLHEDFVWGEKYRGKTSEVLTQLLINIARHHATPRDPDDIRLLDPMCGRGTSLLWALRFGFSSEGVELDPSAIGEFRRGAKKWSKLHRQKHKIREGFVQKANKRGTGKFLDFTVEGRTARLVTGDTANTRDLTRRHDFDLIVSDLPYGVQHLSSDGTRNPLSVVEAAAPGWAASLREGGIMALAFNRYIPKRDALVGAFDGLGLEVVDLDLTHRMSEAILRDVLVMRRTEN